MSVLFFLPEMEKETWTRSSRCTVTTLAQTNNRRQVSHGSGYSLRFESLEGPTHLQATELGGRARRRACVIASMASSSSLSSEFRDALVTVVMEDTEDLQPFLPVLTVTVNSRTPNSSPSLLTSCTCPSVVSEQVGAGRMMELAYIASEYMITVFYNLV